MSKFLNLFKCKKPIIGMIHLKGENKKDIYERMANEIEIYNRHLDGIIIENYFGNFDNLVDALEYVKSLNLNIPIGVNCLNFDAMGFELAIRYNLDFIQIDSVVGHVSSRDEKTLNEFLKLYRSRCNSKLIGGVRFKYQPVLSKNPLKDDLKTAVGRCDAIAVTGNGTGEETSLEKIKSFKKILGDFPLVVAAGVTVDNIEDELKYCDAAIIGSYFKDTYKDTGDVDEEHVIKLMQKVHLIRKEVNND